MPSHLEHCRALVPQPKGQCASNIACFAVAPISRSSQGQLSQRNASIVWPLWQPHAPGLHSPLCWECRATAHPFTVYTGKKKKGSSMSLPACNGPLSITHLALPNPEDSILDFILESYKNPVLMNWGTLCLWCKAYIPKDHLCHLLSSLPQRHNPHFLHTLILQ